MDGVIGWIISLISGIIGGNIAGSALKEQSLGTLGNSIAGLVGGGLGGQLLSALGVLGGGGGGSRRPSGQPRYWQYHWEYSCLRRGRRYSHDDCRLYQEGYGGIRLGRDRHSPRTSDCARRQCEWWSLALSKVLG
jgi:uncharacterized membrane protein YeaQ/YmgE (transglycosylase-associated protein family)